ncbi:MAG: thiolase family protein [Chloroflexi bacterium]|nr:thiolase family protein [Chloroflexota bacterium]
MVPARLNHQYAIVGLGVTKVGHVPGFSGRALAAEAARMAIEDAGLRNEDIDGAIDGRTLSSNNITISTDAFPRVLGLPVNFYYHIGRGGSVAIFSLITALKFLDLGLANYVVIGRGNDRWSKGRGGKQTKVSGMPGFWGEALGATAAVSDHAFFAARHFHEYGTTSEQLGAIAVQERAWACLNPAAYMYGRPITLEDHQKSPIVVYPYHLLDICLVSDGGTAFIVTTGDRAKDCRKPPVYIKGFGFGEHMRKLWWDKQNYTQLDVKPAKEAAFRTAGIELRDVDVAELYDCFTSEVLFQIEDYGWCQKGEGGHFVAAGNIGPGGTIPINTGGGMLSSHHHSGFTPLAEAIIQMRGEGGARQVKNARIALATGHGGEVLGPGMCSSHSCVILGNE